MTNREAHPDYKNYPVEMVVTFAYARDKMRIRKIADRSWTREHDCMPWSDDELFDDDDACGDYGIVILHDPGTAGKPFSFAPVGDGTVKPSALLVALREAEAAIQRAIEMETNKGA